MTDTAKQPDTERRLWAAASDQYEAFRVNIEMESAREALVGQLRFMARCIDERLLSPAGGVLPTRKADETGALVDESDGGADAGS